MKNFFQILVTVTLMQTASSAIALSPQREVVLKLGRMNTILRSGEVSNHASIYLTVYGTSGSHSPTRIVLSEDTGIRCFRVPCPSSRDFTFLINHVEEKNSRTVYQAT